VNGINEIQGAPAFNSGPADADIPASDPINFFRKKIFSMKRGCTEQRKIKILDGRYLR